METWPYEHPLKSGARRAVRQFFLFWVLGAFLIASFMGLFADAHSGILIPALMFGFIPGSIVWLLYRLIRFAVG